MSQLRLTSSRLSERELHRNPRSSLPFDGQRALQTTSDALNEANANRPYPCFAGQTNSVILDVEEHVLT